MTIHTPLALRYLIGRVTREKPAQRVKRLEHDMLGTNPR